MRILIIEDNLNKLKQIRNLLEKKYPNCEIDETYAFNNGMKKILEDNWDLVILDMSLPTYNITSTEGGGDKKPVAGKNIMKRMLNKKIFSPVVGITQFETFDDDKISLESLNMEFESSFSQIWKGTIYYGDDEWASNFEMLLDTLGL